MKRFAVAVILCTMTLHCASRIGFLSFLYEERHQIAYAIGLIAEIPIAICSSDYDFNQGLRIQDHDDSRGALPQISQAREINLFCYSLGLEIIPNRVLLMDGNETGIVERQYPPPPLSIFHPPS